MGTIQGFCDNSPMRFSVPLFQKDNPGLNIRSELLANEDNVAQLLKEYKYDAIISINKPDNPEIETVPFARETLLLSVPETHPLAQSQKIHLASATPMEMAVYCGEGAYVRWLEPFLERLARHHKVKFYNDYFVFRQILEQNNLPTLTTRLVSQYRHDGNHRKVIPITDEGVEIVYRLSYLKANAKNMLPLLTWVQKAQKTLQK